MPDDPFQLYPVIAQIAATFAGFGSLASALDRRSGGDDARIDAYRLWLMLFASLSATVLGLLPATLTALSLGTGLALQLASLAALAALLIYLPMGTRRVLNLRGVVGFSIPGAIANTACALTSFIAFAVCAAGVAANQLAGVYLLGLVAMLGSSIVMFSRVIASMLRPHS